MLLAFISQMPPLSSSHILAYLRSHILAYPRSQLEASQAQLSSAQKIIKGLEGDKVAAASTLSHVHEELASASTVIAQLRFEVLAAKGSEGALVKLGERESQLQAAQLEIKALQSAQHQIEAR